MDVSSSPASRDGPYPLSPREILTHFRLRCNHMLKPRKTNSEEGAMSHHLNGPKVSWGAVSGPDVNQAAQTFGAEVGGRMGGRAPGVAAVRGAAVGADASRPAPATVHAASSSSSRKRKALDEDDVDMDSSRSLSPPSTSSHRPLVASASSPTQSQLGKRRSAVESAFTVTPAKRIKLVWDSDPASHNLAALPPHPHNYSSSSTTTAPEERSLPLARILETLTKQELLAVIQSLVSNDDSLSAKTASLIPRPSLDSASRHLLSVLRTLEEAYPYSKESGFDRTSDYAFGRVRARVLEVVEVLGLYLTHFTEPCSYPSNLTHEYPSQSFAFLETATSLLLQIPRFASAHRNEDSLYEGWRLLARAYRIALQECARRVREEGRVFPAVLVGGWLRELYGAGAAVEVWGVEFGFREAVEEFVRGELGGIVHLGSTSPSASSLFGSSNSAFGVPGSPLVLASAGAARDF